MNDLVHRSQSISIISASHLERKDADFVVATMSGREVYNMLSIRDLKAIRKMTRDELKTFFVGLRNLELHRNEPLTEEKQTSTSD